MAAVIAIALGLCPKCGVLVGTLPAGELGAATTVLYGMIAVPRSGTAGGMMNMGSNLGGLVSPALTPVLAAAIGWENALHIAAGLAALGAALWFGVAIADGTR